MAMGHDCRDGYPPIRMHPIFLPPIRRMTRIHIIPCNLTLAHIQCEAPKIAKFVQITPITMVYGTQLTIVTGAYKPTNITGGPHIVPPLAFWNV